MMGDDQIPLSSIVQPLHYQLLHSKHLQENVCLKLHYHFYSSVTQCGFVSYISFDLHLCDSILLAMMINKSEKILHKPLFYVNSR